MPIFALDKGYLDEKAIIPRIFNHDFLKKGRLPYIRLWEVFARQSQANIDWHRRTWHTSDSHSSSTRDIPFSCSQTDTLLRPGDRDTAVLLPHRPAGGGIRRWRFNRFSVGMPCPNKTVFCTAGINEGYPTSENGK